MIPVDDYAFKRIRNHIAVRAKTRDVAYGIFVDLNSIRGLVYQNPIRHRADQGVGLLPVQ
jgi:hypothetical protein